MKKYELTTHTVKKHNKKLFQIKALRDFSNVKKGDLGGYIEKEANLSHSGDCWVYQWACIRDNAKLSNDAKISGVVEMSGNAKVLNNATMLDWATITDNAVMLNSSTMSEYATAKDNALMKDYTVLTGCATLGGFAKMLGMAKMLGRAKATGRATISERAIAKGKARLKGFATLSGKAKLSGKAIMGHHSLMFGKAKSTKPLYIKTELFYVTISNKHMTIGYEQLTQKKWFNSTDEEICRLRGQDWLEWWKKWKPILKAMIDKRC